jgi:hypothetical protein
LHSKNKGLHLVDAVGGTKERPPPRYACNLNETHPWKKR